MPCFYVVTHELRQVEYTVEAASIEHARKLGESMDGLQPLSSGALIDWTVKSVLPTIPAEEEEEEEA